MGKEKLIEFPGECFFALVECGDNLMLKEIKMITITRETENGLSLKLWAFYFDISVNSLSIILDKYFESSRPTTRHKYRTNKRWHRVDSRHNNLTNKEIMKGLTPDIIKEAKDFLIQKINKISISL